MNFKKYFLINLKQYLVLYIVSFALLATTAVSTVVSYQMYTATYLYCVDGICTPAPNYDIFSDLDGGSLGLLASPLMSMFLVLFILMLIMPLFAMGARYSLTASDTYKQVAQKKNAIRLTNNLTLLLSIIVIFSIVYWGMVIGLAIKHNIAKIPADECYSYIEGEMNCTVYSKATVNFGVFGIMYPIAIALAMLQYFISYLFVSRCNRPINSVFTLVMGELALALIMHTTILFINNGFIMPQIEAFLASHEGQEPPIKTISPISGTGNSSTLFPMFFLLSYFTPLISGSKNAFETISDAQTAIFAISLSIFVILAALGVFAMIFEKDPSGEFAGKPESPRPYQEIIFHIGAFSIGYIAAALVFQSIIGFFVLEVFIAALYYVFLGIMRRNFKINLKNLIPYISITVVNIAIGLIFYFITL